MRQMHTTQPITTLFELSHQSKEAEEAQVELPPLQLHQYSEERVEDPRSLRSREVVAVLPILRMLFNLQIQDKEVPPH